MSNPVIYSPSAQDTFIIGESESLIALCEMLILKGKMGDRFSATLQDDDGNKINVLVGSESGSDNLLNKYLAWQLASNELKESYKNLKPRTITAKSISELRVAA